MFAHLNGSVLKLLAHAVLDLFPQAQLFQDWVEGPLFCARFQVPENCKTVDLDIVENRLIELQNQKVELYPMEMALVSAQALFKANKQRYLQTEVGRTLKNTIDVVKIGPYYDLDRFGFQAEYSKINFKLLSSAITGEKETFLTIIGLVADDKKDLKEFLKQYKNLQKHSHFIYNQEMKFFNQEVLLPNGLKILNCLKQEIDNVFFENGFEKFKVLNSHKEIKKILQVTAENEPSQKVFTWACESKSSHFSPNPLKIGLFQIENNTFDRWMNLVNQESIEEQCISCLNFYRQIIKILGFSYRVRYQRGKCPQLHKILMRVLEPFDAEMTVAKEDHFLLQFDLIDGYGRTLLNPLIKVEKPSFINGKSSYVISGTFCSSLEMLLGQVIEHHKGELPIKWCAQQLKILALKEGLDFGLKLFDYFRKNKIKVSLDSSDQKLSTKLQVAWEEKIPLVVIVGQEECKQMKLTVKNQRLNKELKCSKEELLEVLLEELKEREEN